MRLAIELTSKQQAKEFLKGKALACSCDTL